MLETYQQEISRKRKASRIFWLIVFLFALFLYFFFQGYYPAINFSFRELSFQSGSITGERRDIIRSFGIINVSIKPNDAIMTLGSGSYTHDEKRMTDYGKYQLSAIREGYLPSNIEFIIDRETPYYIDILSLLPTVRYNRSGSGWSHIAKIDDNHWSAHTRSGMILLDEDFTAKNLISEVTYTNIGEGYFLSGQTIISYDSRKEVWEEKIWSGSILFLEDCEDVISIKMGKLWCPIKKKILTEKGKTYTGVVSIGTNYIELDTYILVGESPYNQLPLGNRTPGEKSIFLEKNTLWYSASGGSFLVIEKDSKIAKKSPFYTGLEKIEYSTWIEGNLYIIGKRNEKRLLLTYDSRNETFSPPIPFPEIPLTEVRIEKREGNLFFKTKTALLFLYHNSKDIEWLIEGEIIAFGKNGALYKKEGGDVWKANWKEIENL